MVDTPRLPADVDLYWPVLKALESLGGSGTIREIEAKVAELEGFSNEQLAVLHREGPSSEINYRMAWARTYLKAVGALENSTRGVWAITEEGRRLTESDMPGLVRRARDELTRRREERRRVRGRRPSERADEPDEWKDRVLEILQSLPPAAFERLAQRLLREAGFVSVEVTGRSGDGGIDGVGMLRLNQLMSFPLFFQCKRYSGNVGPDKVREFRGAMAGRGDKGILITTGTFTREAENEARRPGVTPIDLIDGEQLCELLKENGLGLSVEKIETEQVRVDAGWFSDI
ncbi:restriction endonuclease [soil metagenome]